MRQTSGHGILVHLQCRDSYSVTQSAGIFCYLVCRFVPSRSLSQVRGCRFLSEGNCGSASGMIKWERVRVLVSRARRAHVACASARGVFRSTCFVVASRAHTLPLRENEFQSNFAVPSPPRAARSAAYPGPGRGAEWRRASYAKNLVFDLILNAFPTFECNRGRRKSRRESYGQSTARR